MILLSVVHGILGLRCKMAQTCVRCHQQVYSLRGTVNTQVTFSKVLGCHMMPVPDASSILEHPYFFLGKQARHESGRQSDGSGQLCEWVRAKQAECWMQPVCNAKESPNLLSILTLQRG